LQTITYLSNLSDGELQAPRMSVSQQVLHGQKTGQVLDILNVFLCKMLNYRVLSLQYISTVIWKSILWLNLTSHRAWETEWAFKNN